MLSPHDVSMLRARLVVAQKESEERGDSAPDLLMPEMLRAPYPGWRVYLAELHNADTLDEIDALQSRLAAAEFRAASATAEAERARGLLGEAMIALTTMRGFAGLAVRIERHLASRPEGEVRHGE